METIDAITLRRSVRKYKDIPVEFEKLGNILTAARLAPSSGNVQDWKFILITNEETRKKIAEACVHQFWMQDAPVHIVACAHPKQIGTFYGARGEKKYSQHNCAAAVENMLIAATAQGLGSCWVGAFEEGILRKTLKIPPDADPVAVVTIGYADEKPKMPNKFKMENVTFIEEYGNRVKDPAIYYGYYSEYVQKAVKKGKDMLKKIVEKKNNK